MNKKKESLKFYFFHFLAGGKADAGSASRALFFPEALEEEEADEEAD